MLKENIEVESPAVAARRIVSGWIDPKPYKLQPDHERELQNAVCNGLEAVARQCASIAVAWSNAALTPESRGQCYLIWREIAKTFGFYSSTMEAAETSDNETPDGEGCEYDEDGVAY